MKLFANQASVETANDYTKRNFVFRLHAPDGSEFLFGADSEEQQEEWVSLPLKNPFYVFFVFCTLPSPVLFQLCVCLDHVPHEIWYV